MRVICFLILMLVSLSSWGQSPLPDERVLWQLLHAGRLRLLSQAIEEYRRNHPGWEPPAALLQELRRRRHRQQAKPPGNFIATVIRQQDWPRLIRLARKHPRLFDCHHPDRLQALSLGYAKVGDVETAFRHYRHLLGCPGVDAEAVLRAALWQLPSSDFGALLEQVRGKLGTAAWDRLHYQSRRRRLLSLNREEKLPSLLHEAEPLADAIVAHRDLDLIRVLGWAAYRRKAWQTAKFWFRTGLDLQPDEESAYGLALTYRQLGDTHNLLALAGRFADDSARIRHLAGDYLLARAWDAYRRQDFPRSHHLVQRALPWLERTEDARYLMGWLALKTGKPQAAIARFTPLYRAHPRQERYAEALVQAYLRSGVDPDRLAVEPSLEPVFRRYRARLHYAHKQFLLAHRFGAATFPTLEHIDSPAIDTGTLYRRKSGDRGLDRLEILMVPLFSATYVHGDQRFGISLGRIDLSSGKLNDAGRLAANEDQAARLRADPPIHALQAAWLELTYRREGQLNPYFTLGFTPIDDLIAPRPTFRLGLQDHRGKLHWNVELYSQPVRLSLLSYTGWKVLGKKWGRVLRNGLQGHGNLLVGDRWNVYQFFDVAFLDGKRTKDNWAIHYTIAPGYDLSLPGFDTFTLGPYFDFQHYGNNQNHFRLGHGGYFSPQRFYAGGVQLNVRTEEGKSLLLEGRLALGVQHFREEAAPWFPIGCPYANCDGSYPGNRATNFAPDLRLRLVWQPHPLLQLGSGVYARKTGDFKEVGAGIFLRLFFEPRKGVFSNDLPAYLFAAIE